MDAPNELFPRSSAGSFSCCGLNHAPGVDAAVKVEHSRERRPSVITPICNDNRKAVDGRGTNLRLNFAWTSLSASSFRGFNLRYNYDQHTLSEVAYERRYQLRRQVRQRKTQRLRRKRVRSQSAYLFNHGSTCR